MLQAREGLMAPHEGEDARGDEDEGQGEAL